MTQLDVCFRYGVPPGEAEMRALSNAREVYGIRKIGFDEKELGKGSGRSIEGLNLVEALSRCADWIDKYGGHEMAAGLAIQEKNIDLFSEAFRRVTMRT